MAPGLHSQCVPVLISGNELGAVTDGWSEGSKKGGIIDDPRIKTRTICVSENIWDLYDENTIEG